MASASRRVELARTWSVLAPLTIRPEAWTLAGSLLRLLVAILPTLRAALRSRRAPAVEDLAIRERLANLAVRRRTVTRPADRRFWILLRRLWSGSAGILATVRPDTVVRWRRTGFRSYWNGLSRRGGAHRAPSPATRGA
jgi:hypothetical protein